MESYFSRYGNNVYSIESGVSVKFGSFRSGMLIETSIVGAYYLGANVLEKLLSLADNRRVVVRHTTANKKDPMAMAVYVGMEQIGWLPAEMAVAMAHFIAHDRGATYRELGNYIMQGYIVGGPTHNGARRHMNLRVDPIYLP